MGSSIPARPPLTGKGGEGQIGFRGKVQKTETAWSEYRIKPLKGKLDLGRKPKSGTTGLERGTAFSPIKKPQGCPGVGKNRWCRRKREIRNLL
jgi:hypothetical protein